MPDKKQIPVYTPKKKVCSNCHEPFIPQDPTHKLCRDCWYDAQPKCKKCHKPLSISDIAQKHQYHDKCFPKA